MMPALQTFPQAQGVRLNCPRKRPDQWSARPPPRASRSPCGREGPEGPLGGQAWPQQRRVDPIMKEMIVKETVDANFMKI